MRAASARHLRFVRDRGVGGREGERERGRGGRGPWSGDLFFFIGFDRLGDEI